MHAKPRDAGKDPVRYPPPATGKRREPIQRRPLPGNEPCIEPEYLDPPEAVRDPGTERRVAMWC